MTSHLPHLVAVALAAATPTELLASDGQRLARHDAGCRRRSGTLASDFDGQSAARAGCARFDAARHSRSLRESLGTRRQREPAVDLGGGGKEETGPRCFGRLTFIRPTGQPDRAAERVATDGARAGIGERAARGDGARVFGSRRIAGAGGYRAVGERVAGGFGGGAGGDWAGGRCRQTLRMKADDAGDECDLRHGVAEAGRDGSGGAECADGRGGFGNSAGSICVTCGSIGWPARARRR